MKLMWDAIGTEFGGRHHLYELNYAGAARASGEMKKMRELSQKCVSEYDVDGWKISGLK